MDSFTINKIAGAILGTFLFLFAIQLVSELIFPEPESHQTGHDEAEAPTDGAAPDAAAPAAAAAEIDLPTALASANADTGGKIFKKCAACHSVTAADGNKIGPNLHDVMGRKVASAAGFNYSPAMTNFGGVWTAERLNKYLASPKEAIPGNKMAFAGLKKITERADVILFLQVNSPKAPPLPVK
ncbi:MAG TPA: cytochrome c family protein [Alphaproteobacteria bacterium]|nr:cytochrome c family protein [Alphaproteobacteria bacterium]